MVVAASLFIHLSALQVFAQNTFINSLGLNPFILEISLLANIISTSSSPFSVYTNDQYSSYDPFTLPYTTIPNSKDFNPFPYPFKIGNTTGLDFSFETNDVYNPVSFLNSGYPDLSITALGFPYSERSIGLNLLSPFFYPGFTGTILPFVSPVLFPGFISNPFVL